METKANHIVVTNTNTFAHILIIHKLSTTVISNIFIDNRVRFINTTVSVYIEILPISLYEKIMS